MKTFSQESMTKMELKKYIIDVNDFPIKGVTFRDITPLLANPRAFNYVVDQMAKHVESFQPDLIMGPESRGFIFATAIAAKLNLGFIPVRKPGKLPRKVLNRSYELEYGKNELEIHTDSIQPGQKVVIVDDLLATGGTINASIDMVHELGGEVLGCVFLINLKDLEGHKILKDYNIKYLLEY